MARSDAHDREVELTIGTLLRWGVIVSAAVVLGGGACHLAAHGGIARDYRHFHAEAQDLRTIAGVVAGAMHLSCPHIIQLGLLLLIATPVARVAFSVLVFLEERDWTFVFITVLVLAILLFSLIDGQRWL